MGNDQAGAGDGDRVEQRSWERSGDDRRFSSGGDDRRSGGGRPADRGSYAARGPRADDRRGGAAGRGDRARPDRAGRPDRSGPARPARIAVAGSRRPGPAIEAPEDIDPRELAPEVRSQLRTLSKLTADKVARHLVAAGRLVDEDPQAALEHARAARALGARVAVVREAVGETAYAAGEWAEAIAELRTARRITGDDSALPLIADSERALGRPERALRIAQSQEVAALEPDVRAEMLIVEAGARRDLGQLDAALNTLEGPGLDRRKVEPWSARLWYAYADLLLAAGRADESREWFVAAAAADTEGATDADERILQLDGVEVVFDEDEEFDEEAAEDAEDLGGDDVVDDDADSGVAGAADDADDDLGVADDGVDADGAEASGVANSGVAHDDAADASLADDGSDADGGSDADDGSDAEDALAEDGLADDPLAEDAVVEDVPTTAEANKGGNSVGEESVGPLVFTHAEPQPEEPAATAHGVEPALFSDVPAEDDDS